MDTAHMTALQWVPWSEEWKLTPPGPAAPGRSSQGALPLYPHKRVAGLNVLIVISGCPRATRGPPQLPSRLFLLVLVHSLVFPKRGVN